MSQETIEWLNTQTLIGMTDKRGNAWHYKAEAQGEESNHYAGPVPVEDAIRRLFSWNAIEVPLYVALPNGDDGIQYVNVPDAKAIARDDTGAVLGMHSDGFGVDGHQFHEWLLEKAVMLGLPLTSCGLLKGGAVAWAQFGLDEVRTTTSGVSFLQNLLMSSSWNGSLASTAKDCTTVVVCDNTMAAGQAERGGFNISVKHTRHSKAKLDQANEALEHVLGMADAFAAEVERLCAIEVSADQFVKVNDLLIPLPADGNKRGTTVATDKRDRIEQLYKYDSRCAPWQGTGFGVVQTFNTWAHHEAQVRKGAERGARNLENVLSGKLAKLDASVIEAVTLVTSNA